MESDKIQRISQQQNLQNWQNYLNFGPQLLADRIKTPQKFSIFEGNDVL